MIRHYCDICDKQVNNPEWLGLVKFKAFVTGKEFDEYTDVCAKCRGSIDGHIQELRNRPKAKEVRRDD